MKVYLVFDDKEQLNSDLCLDINILARANYKFFVSYSDRQILMFNENIIFYYVLSNYIVKTNKNLLNRIKVFHNDNYNILNIIKEKNID